MLSICMRTFLCCKGSCQTARTGQGQDEGHVQGHDAAGEIPTLRNGYDKYYINII